MAAQDAHERDQYEDEAAAADADADAGQPAQPGRTHLSAAGLRARGWTVAMVRELLGEPDLVRANAVSRSAPWTRLYRIERVEAAERSEEFRALSAVAARRSPGARAASQRRRREVAARIAAEPLEVPRLSAARLTVLAVAHHERRLGEQGSGSREQAGDPAPVESSGSGILDRWKVDYLRHRLTRHDDILGDLRDSAGRAAAEELLRRKVYAAIAEAYPELTQECERQARALPDRGGADAGNSDARTGAGAHDRQIDRRAPRHGPQEPP
ncbi:hypothetical protein ABZ078_38995 [Streptomyces sp. NPDC006385]|uniref:hypothetical protein n=1 Tax=Streptomyces sp. NPDC006385 TaxID=3156761 RepID=UPI0033A48EE4